MFNKILKSMALATVATAMFVGSVYAGDKAEEAAPSLYDRLGGWDSITQIVTDTVALHKANPEISHFFSDVETDKLIHHVATFFAAGTGGPQQYEGRDMTAAHADMNMSNAEFDSAVADVLKALDKNGIGSTERSEVAAILESLRPAVMGTAET